jgi:Protein of unknown function (DUF3106)
MRLLRKTGPTYLHGWKYLGTGLLMTALLTGAGSSLAQLDKHVPAASAATSGRAAAPGKPLAAKTQVSASKPSWTELTPMQQQTLKPLAASWATLSEAQKRKWLQISKNYSSLPTPDQETMHSRMSEWAALSPQQRAEARLNFGKTKELSKQLSPEEKKAKWESYQALSPEEKQKLAAKASRPAGAAPALKPVAPQKLAVIPSHVAKPELTPVHRQEAPPPAPAAATPIRPVEDPTHGSTTAGSN